MKVILPEQVFVYRDEQFTAWKRGERSLVPHFIERHPDYDNQPKYHFGEVFVIDTFNRLCGWKGFRFYALGLWELNNPKYAKSREVIARLFPKDKLAEFRLCSPSGKGEPDVMLYHDDGRTLFLEVKKGIDRVSQEQLAKLACIKSILGADVGIVYLREESQNYKPKSYELDLDKRIGRVLRNTRNQQ